MAGLLMTIVMAQAASLAVTSLPAGPLKPAEEAQVVSPADAAKLQYQRRYGPQVAATTRCVPKPGEDVTVCARRPGTRSEYELPLPDERGKNGDVVRVAGEAARGDIGPAAGRGPQAAPGARSIGLTKKVVGEN